MTLEIIGYVMVKDLPRVSELLILAGFEDSISEHSDSSGDEVWVDIEIYPRALDVLQDAGLVSEQELQQIIQEDVTILLLY